MRSPLVQLLDGAPVCAAVRHAVPRRVQRQPAEERAGDRRDVPPGRAAGLERRLAGDAGRRGRSSRRSSSSRARRARWPIASTRRRSPAWVKIAEIGIMALGAWGLWLAERAAAASRRSSASARTRPSSARSSTRCCRSTCAKTSWSPATRSSRRARSSRSCSARSSAAASCCSTTARSIVGGCGVAGALARLARRAPDPAGAARRRRDAPRPAPAARHDRASSRHVDVAPGAVAADPRGVVVLAVRRDRRLGTAGRSPRTCSSRTSRS